MLWASRNSAKKMQFLLIKFWAKMISCSSLRKIIEQFCFFNNDDQKEKSIVSQCLLLLYLYFIIFPHSVSNLDKSFKTLTNIGIKCTQLVIANDILHFSNKALFETTKITMWNIAKWLLNNHVCKNAEFLIQMNHCF